MTLSRKEMVKKAALDVLKAFIIGVAAAAAAAIILFACGFLFGSFQIVNGFEVVKDGLLLIGAIGLFLVAGMLLAEAKNGWRQHFSVVGLKTVVLIISAAFLLNASVADLILLNL